MKVEKMVYGIYPKKESLRRKISEWERGIISSEKISEALQEEKDRISDFFSRNNIDYYTDPLFNWYDIFRPLSITVDDIELGPLTRYLETNTFYRQPIVSSIKGLRRDVRDFSEIEDSLPLPLFKIDNGSKAFFPSPYSFYMMSVHKPGITLEKFSESILQVYEKILSEYKTRDVALYEALPYNSTDLGFFDGFNGKFNVSLITRGRIAEKNFQGIRNPFASIVTEKDYLDVAKGHSRIPGLKVVDVFRTKIETPEEIAGKIGDEENILVTTADYMDFLPENVAGKKVEVIGKIGE